MKLVVFGLTVSSSWGNGHATLWRGLCGSLARRRHSVVFFERNVPYYSSTRDLFELPGGGDLMLYDDWAEVLPEALRHAADADVAMVTSYCPDAVAAMEIILNSRAPVRVFYDLDTPVTLARLNAGESVDYIGSRGLADFDLVLSYTGGRSLEELRRRLGARRVAPLYGSADPAVHKPVPPDLVIRPIWAISARTRRIAMPRYGRSRGAGAPFARATVSHRRLDVRSQLSMAEQYLLCQPPAAGRSSGVLLFHEIDPECHAPRHGGNGLLPVRAALRSDRGRRGRPERRLGGD